MKSLLPVMAGLVGTFSMSLFTEVLFLVFKRNYRIVRILGNMLQFKKVTPVESTPPAGIYAMAFVLHYAIGVIFAYLYYWLIEAGILNMTLAHGFLFGVSIGTVGIICWRIFFAIHPGPPPVQLKYYLPIIWLGHIVLSLVMMATYRIYW